MFYMMYLYVKEGVVNKCIKDIKQVDVICDIFTESQKLLFYKTYFAQFAKNQKHAETSNVINVDILFVHKTAFAP